MPVQSRVDLPAPFQGLERLIAVSPTDHCCDSETPGATEGSTR